MIKTTASDYSEYVKIDMKKELEPVEESIDDMLTRLEEFENMVLMVQQERGNAIGLTGTLTQVIDRKTDFDNLCSKVDVLESMVINVRETLDSLEDQIQIAEEQLGCAENNSLKNFFLPKIFKKTPETKVSSSRESAPLFKVDEYFLQSDHEEHK